MVTLRVRGEEIEVDLTGTADQVDDAPINMPLVGTADIAIWLTIRSVLLDTAIHGHIPVNEGLTRPIKLTVPKGCLANPIFPAPTIARFCPGNQLADTVMKALAQAAPQWTQALCPMTIKSARPARSSPQKYMSPSAFRVRFSIWPA